MADVKGLRAVPILVLCYPVSLSTLISLGIVFQQQALTLSTAACSRWARTRQEQKKHVGVRTDTK